LRAELARDAFITGLDSSTVRQRLLEEDTLSFQSAVTKALVLERAHKRASFHLSDVQSSIAAGHSSKSCYFCVGKIHSRSQCPAKDACCFSCGKREHFQKVCSVKPKARAQKKSFSSRTDRANIVSTSLPETSTDTSSDIPNTVAALNTPCLPSLTTLTVAAVKNLELALIPATIEGLKVTLHFRILAHATCISARKLPNVSV